MRKRAREVEDSEGSPPVRDPRRVNRRGRPSLPRANQEMDMPDDLSDVQRGHEHKHGHKRSYQLCRDVYCLA
jgi:hypothetical protein